MKEEKNVEVPKELIGLPLVLIDMKAVEIPEDEDETDYFYDNFAYPGIVVASAMEGDCTILFAGEEGEGADDPDEAYWHAMDLIKEYCEDQYSEDDPEIDVSMAETIEATGFDAEEEIETIAAGLNQYYCPNEPIDYSYNENLEGLIFFIMKGSRGTAFQINEFGGMDELDINKEQFDELVRLYGQ